MTDGDVRFFDRFARVYDAVMPSTDPETLARGLEGSTGKIERVVDVAGGTGRAVEAIDAPERVVVDASIGMLGRVPPGISALQGTADRLPIRDASVDAVLIVDALHHLPEQRTAIREAARVLRPGGVLVVRDFDRSSVGGRLIELAEHGVGMRSSFLSVEEIADAVRAAGLDTAVIDGGIACTVIGGKP